MPLFRNSIPSFSYTLHNGIDARGQQMVYLRYHIAGAYKFRTTGFKIKPEYWDAGRQRIRPDAPDAGRINKRLDRMMEVVKAAFMNYEGPMSPLRLDDLLESSYVSERDRSFITPFAEYALEVNDRRYKEGKLQYQSWYDKKNYIAAFEKYVHHYLGHRPYFLNEVDASDLEGYIEYRRRVLGNTSEELVSKSLQALVAAVESACEEGLVGSEKAKKVRAVYDDFREPLPSEGGEKQAFLTEDAISKLEEYLRCTTNEVQFKAVSVFLFSYYACGMRFADILLLRWTDVSGEYITARQMRTGIHPSILPPISDKMRNLLELWEGRFPQYVFGLIDESVNLNSSDSIRAARLACNNEINRALRHLGREMGICKELTLSVARDTFASHALSKGISIYTVSKLLRHVNVEQTARRYSALVQKMVERDVEILKIFPD